MLDFDLTLKNDELCLVGRSANRGGMDEAGLYLRDTRFLSAFSVAISGVPLEPLSVQALSATEAIIVSTPQTGHEERTGIPGSGLVVRQRIALGTALEVTFEVQGFGSWASTAMLEIQIAADFRDMFDIRGMTPQVRPTLHDPRTHPDRSVTLSATGGDGQTARLEVTFDQSPQNDLIMTTTSNASLEIDFPVMLSFPLVLSSGNIETMNLSLLPIPVGPAQEPQERSQSRIEVKSSNRDLEEMILRADLDLAMLQTAFPDGNMPAAGIPWYIAPFGRDSLIVALQTMHVYPERVWATLRLLARRQGERIDEFREEEPGKILHELRYGDMARTRQVPHTPYFGSIDSTPLFAMTFAQAYRWHEDNEMYDELILHVRRALVWIEEYGDLDGDGLIEFGDKSKDGRHITQQGWKDSSDSLHFASGDPVGGPFALVEIQGYVYAAYAWMAEAARMRGDEVWATELRKSAERIRAAVEERFWMEDQGFYAQALDGQKRPVDAISSNPGHLLFCGLPSRERAALVADRLLQLDMLTRWGIRTLSSKMTTYNPMSYHNGSIWPHDNSLTMWGLKSYGFNEAASTVAKCLIRLSAHDPERRLSELYCGFDTEDDRIEPITYPVSCRPQAWAAGCGPLLARAIFGLDIAKQTFGVGTEPIGTDLVANISLAGIRARGEEWVLRMADRHGIAMHGAFDDDERE